jgi:hypothetical protein
MELQHLQTPTVEVTEKHTFIHVQEKINDEMDDSIPRLTRRPRAFTAPPELLRRCCEALLKDEITSTDGCHDYSTEYDSWDARSTCSWPSEPGNDEVSSEVSSSCSTSLAAPFDHVDVLGASYLTQAEPEWTPGTFHQPFLPAAADGYSTTPYNTDYALVCFYYPQVTTSSTSDEQLVTTDTQSATASSYRRDRRGGKLAKNRRLKGARAVEVQGPTTVNLKNLPPNCTLSSVQATLDQEGFSGYYNFIHVPVNFRNRTSLGYAQVNLLDHSLSEMFCQHFTGFTNWATDTSSCELLGCVADFTASHQGIDTLIERYRNSPLMHESVPDEFKPALFGNSMRIQFPAPTMRIKAPRMRHSKQSDIIGEGEV